MMPHGDRAVRAADVRRVTPGFRARTLILAPAIVTVFVAASAVLGGLATGSSANGLGHARGFPDSGGAAALSPASSRAAATVGPLAVLGTIAVGGLPEFATYDAYTGTIYVPNWANGNVSLIEGTAVVGTAPAGLVPFSATYDPANHYVYVVNRDSNNVTVLDGTAVVGNVHVGSAPKFATYDSANGFLYVDNSGSSNVSVLSGTSVLATVPVGQDPSSPVVGGGSGGGGGGGWAPTPAASLPPVYVPNTGSDTVTVIGGATGTTVEATVPVGASPQFATWDPQNVWLYVPNNNSSNVSILSSVSPYNVLYTVSVGSNPFSASYNSSTTDVVVVNYGSANLSVLGGALTNTVTATIPVGTGPQFLAQDPPPIDRWLVPNTGSGNVSVISGTTDQGSLPGGSFPVFGTVDPETQDVYVQNFLSANVTVIGPAGNATVPVTFKAAGLPAGSTWSVTSGAPPVTVSNRTVHSSGQLVVDTPKGAFRYVIAGPSGYAPAKITGPGVPSLVETNVSGPTSLSVTFALVENLTFRESGLPTGASWTVVLRSPLASGGPAPQAASTTTTSLSFSAVKGKWTFEVSGPAHYLAKPATGSVGVPAHASVKTVKFALVVGKVTFSESGLKKGTLWGVNVSGPVDCNVNGTASKLTCLLVSGNYTFTVRPVPGETATPPSGPLSVAAPSPLKVTIEFSA